MPSWLRWLRELWSGKPGTPVGEWSEQDQELMRRQGFADPVTLWAHLLRLDDRLAKLEEKDAS